MDSMLRETPYGSVIAILAHLLMYQIANVKLQESGDFGSIET